MSRLVPERNWSRAYVSGLFVLSCRNEKALIIRLETFRHVNRLLRSHVIVIVQRYA